jgi:excisionase family DNA binding protein
MKLLTIPEVADILKVTRVTVYRYIKCGRFPVHTLPAGMRVSEDDLSRLVLTTMRPISTA